jgi:glycosyltransferase involved in cell wall biosynthesis
MSELEISVIIPVRNEANKIGNCLQAVLAQSVESYEVVVVDGYSTDRTVEIAQRYPVRILYENYASIGGSRQIGIENAMGKYVAFTDADAIPDKEWLKCLVMEFKEGIVGVGGKIINIDHGFWQRSINLAFSTFLGSANSVQGRPFKKKRLVSSISACNAMYRREDIMEAGGLNPSVISEDSELNGRLLKKGKLLYTPEAVVIHDQDKGLKDFAKLMYRWGKGIVETRRWIMQVVPPLLLPFLIPCAIFLPKVFFVLLGFYLLSIVAVGANFAIKKKDTRYLVSIPVVYFIEHTLYSAGVWKEIIYPKRIKSQPASDKSNSKNRGEQE